MEKQGVVKQGVTPPTNPPKGEKVAAKQSPQQLDDNATKRLADAAADKLK